jgi:hypothetical protein
MGIKRIKISLKKPVRPAGLEHRPAGLEIGEQLEKTISEFKRKIRQNLPETEKNKFADSKISLGNLFKQAVNQIEGYGKVLSPGYIKDSPEKKKAVARAPTKVEPRVTKTMKEWADWYGRSQSAFRKAVKNKTGGPLSGFRIKKTQKYTIPNRILRVIHPDKYIKLTA